MKDVLLITPPFTQLNTPYPATAYLKGFLNTKDISSFQCDLGIEVILKIFSHHGLREIFFLADREGSISSENAERMFYLRADYLKTIGAAIDFLHGKQPSLARQICTRNFFPEASRFDQIDDLEWAFGSMGMQDKAKHLATLFLEDISDFIVECIDPEFGFSRYAERLGFSANSFDELYDQLQNEPSYVDKIVLELLSEKIEQLEPKLICFSVPFPGNLYSAFRCAEMIQESNPEITVAMGGGFPNTELRSVSDSRVFDFFDYITLDDGELPVELLVRSLSEKDVAFKRTFYCENGTVQYDNSCAQADYKQAQVGTPDYSDLLLDSYISVIEVANPMHSLWSDGRWNKLTMAHGCYWGKCTFCDISLDYIKLYEPVAAKLLVDRMEELTAQTGESGFHFVDEAAPPALMRALAIEIIRRKLVVTWWTNIRFEKSFTHDLVVLLKESGCIGVSGGLEVASDRLLKLIDKGVSVEQVARVTRNFTEAGIMVHSYLMYGYPTQTVQETIDSLEMVRQLFELGIIQSGFWHQFALTTHSPIGQSPEEYGITPHLNDITFANNDVQFTDATGIDHNKFSFGLKKSLFNFMHGLGFDLPLSDWFDQNEMGFKVPRTTIPSNYIEECLENEPMEFMKSTAKPIWLGGDPEVSRFEKSKRGETWEMLGVTIHTRTDLIEVSLPLEEGIWFIDQLEDLTVESPSRKTIAALKKDFETYFDDFEPFWYSNAMLQLREYGILVSS
ncbi:MAG: B12-binding domain-containing radical SAM protein [Crocinitomicaceae bacterium]|nr:B12-binding domain-containing radical SAM protein [Crocinitomicaceae bacterium]